MTRPKIAINGFGRIGRLVARALVEADLPVDLVAVNDQVDAGMLAHLLKHDTVHGRFPGEVHAEDDQLVINGRKVAVLNEDDPRRLPWQRLGVDIVVECTGLFTKREDLQKHLDAGATRAVVSAPGDGLDVTLVLGVNDEDYDPKTHYLVSNASCTTNCLAPVLKVLHDAFIVEHAVMTTVHAYTNDQKLLDAPHKDPRRARAAAQSFLPTSTGAARAIGQVIPALDGKVDGIAVRVPVANVSLVDLTAQLGKTVTKDDLEQAFRRAEEGPMKGILRCEAESLVSVDYNHDPASAVVDLPGLMIVGDRFVKVLAWYDNEWAYAMRTAELAMKIWRKDQHQTTTRPPVSQDHRA